MMVPISGLIDFIFSRSIENVSSITSALIKPGLRIRATKSQ